MIHHPLLLTVAVLDVLAGLLLACAAVTAIQVVLRWTPERANRAQLRLEGRAEAASILARNALWLLLSNSLALVVAIAVVLPELVPGAMCGTGVLQATGSGGARALVLRALALGLLGAWHLIDRLDRSAPRSPLASASARALLLSVPLVGLAITDTLRAFASLSVHQPVSCCAAVYDQVRRAPAVATAQGDVWVWGTAAGGALLIGLGVLLWRARPAWHHRLVGATGVLALAWVVAAAFVLVRMLASYHYGVLHHHCPWCLFLPEHYCAGFAAFGALAWAAFEGPAAWLAVATARRCGLIAAAATARARAAGWHLAVAVALFAFVAGLPALVYRLRFGTWLDGGL